MKLRFISTKIHGYLDYATAALLPVLPRALGWDRPVTRLHDAVATATAGQSLVTDYELGVVRKLPMKAHLTMDALTGVLLLTSAAMLNQQPKAVRGTVMGVGLLYVAAALMTQTRPRRKVRPRLPQGLSPMELYAKARRPLAAERGTMVRSVSGAGRLAHLR